MDFHVKLQKFDNIFIPGANVGLRSACPALAGMKSGQISEFCVSNIFP